MTKYGGPVKAETLGAGGEFFGDEAEGFAVYSRNITPAAIGNWTDGELIRAFTSGVSKDGTPLPIMPYPRYARLSREDVESIVAYLRTPSRCSTPFPGDGALSAAVDRPDDAQGGRAAADTGAHRQSGLRRIHAQRGGLR